MSTPKKEKKGLFGALSTLVGNIFGSKDSGVTAPDYAGFTIETLVGKHPTKNLLDLVKGNYQAITEVDAQGAAMRLETTVGWFIKLNKPSSINYAGYPDISLQPSGITQLVFVQKNINGDNSFEYKKYPVNIDLNSPLNSNGDFDLITTLSPTYTEFQLSQYQQDAYLNIIGATTAKKNKQLQFFEAGTNAIFFSRSQLLMMHRLLSESSKRTILFSGSYYNLGRAGAQQHMYEFKYLDHTLDEKPTIPEWFTLKAEVVLKEELAVGNDFYEQNQSPIITEDATLEEHLAENCDLVKSAKSAVLFLGFTCPPGWAAVAPALDATYNAFDSGFGTGGLSISKDLLCALLEEIKTAGYDDVGTP